MALQWGCQKHSLLAKFPQLIESQRWLITSKRAAELEIPSSGGYIGGDSFQAGFGTFLPAPEVENVIGVGLLYVLYLKQQ